MLSIQEVGVDIMSGRPKKFYVFVGTEYGVKSTYIDLLKKHYGEYSEGYSVSDLLSFMSTKHLIPLKPKLYVVRYDEDFISKLDNSTESKIRSSNIIGTIVLIYENEKHASKLDKYLPNNTVRIETVSDKFVSRYLHRDFPNLPDHIIDMACKHSDNYSQAKMMCLSLSHGDIEKTYQLDDSQFSDLFGIKHTSDDSQVKSAICSRNFPYILDVLERYSDTYDNFLYSILSAMLELEKISCNRYTESALSGYVKRWTRKDIYNMFMHTYDELKKLRSYTSDGKSSVIYLAGLTQFIEIPDLEEM